MLNSDLKKQVTQVLSSLQHHYTLVALVDPKHPSRAELLELLGELTDCSPKILLQTEDGEALQFTILKDDQPTRITFRAVPNGHEFTSLLMAILNLDGQGKNLPDPTVTQRIQALEGDIQLLSYISLTCTNCPEVVQSLNIITLLNPNIHHQIIDGALYLDEVDALGVQAVPTVYAGDQILHVGRATLAELLQQLEQNYNSSYNASEKNRFYDVVIAGGGPAGVSAAIYAARKGQKVALISDKIGGQVNETHGIENLISVPYTTGPELAAQLLEHLRAYPVDVFENRSITSLTTKSGLKQVTTSLDEVFDSPALIIATGASWRRLGVPGEQEHIGAGVAFCTHCDGPFYKNKKVVVVGGGNSGLEAAVDLSGIAAEVVVLEYDHRLRGDKVLQEKITTLDNVKIVTSAQTTEILGDGSKITALKYIDRNTDTEIQLDTEGVFVQIGLSPNSSIFAESVQTTKRGEIEIDTHCRTSVPGIYAAGDVTTVPYKQIVVAMGEGSKAALSAFDDSIKGLLETRDAVAELN